MKSFRTKSQALAEKTWSGSWQIDSFLVSIKQDFNGTTALATGTILVNVEISVDQDLVIIIWHTPEVDEMHRSPPLFSNYPKHTILRSEAPTEH